MRMQMNQPAGAGEHLAPGAFDSQIGKTVPVRIGGGRTVNGVVEAADVAADGRSVVLTLDVDLGASALSAGPGSYSLR